MKTLVRVSALWVLLQKPYSMYERSRATHQPTKSHHTPRPIQVVTNHNRLAVFRTTIAAKATPTAATKPGTKSSSCMSGE